MLSRRRRRRYGRLERGADRSTRSAEEAARRGASTGLRGTWPSRLSSSGTSGVPRSSWTPRWKLTGALLRIVRGTSRQGVEAALPSGSTGNGDPLHAPPRSACVPRVCRSRGSTLGFTSLKVRRPSTTPMAKGLGGSKCHAGQRCPHQTLSARSARRPRSQATPVGGTDPEPPGSGPNARPQRKPGRIGGRSDGPAGVPNATSLGGPPDAATTGLDAAVSSGWHDRPWCSRVSGQARPVSALWRGAAGDPGFDDGAPLAS